MFRRFGHPHRLLRLSGDVNRSVTSGRQTGRRPVQTAGTPPRSSRAPHLARPGSTPGSAFEDRGHHGPDLHLPVRGRGDAAAGQPAASRTRPTATHRAVLVVAAVRPTSSRWASWSASIGCRSGRSSVAARGRHRDGQPRRLLRRRSNGADAYALFYFWVVLAACYFLRPAGSPSRHLALRFGRVRAVVILARGDVSLAGAQLGHGLPARLLVAGSLMSALREQVERLLDSSRRAARTDSLTGLANRRELDERFAAELERSDPDGAAALDPRSSTSIGSRSSTTGSGTAAGQRALLQLAAALRRGTRTGDLARPPRRRGVRGAGAGDRRAEEGLLLAERLRARSTQRLRPRARPPDDQLRGGELPDPRDHARGAAARCRPRPSRPRRQGATARWSSATPHEPGAGREQVGDRARPARASPRSCRSPRRSIAARARRRTRVASPAMRSGWRNG